ncbi:hypothetical protein MSG28_007324 [Choristoneura fumiferana]|uniref:Uncharacterized protein n=1 Tax=Choristoneura fumiferana TaxID=7141 RepID=A0ACC0JWM2_CHOFU|nr:hypothetical protein MSG28_007324 [Choristoneura fumiferana]
MRKLCLALRPKGGDNSNTPVGGGRLLKASSISGASVVASAHETVDLGAETCASDNGADTTPPIRDPALDLVEEFRLFRAEFAAMRAEIASIHKEVSEMRVTLGSFTARIDAVEDRVAHLEERLIDGTVDACRKELQENIAQLKSELNDRDQDLLINDLEISGILEAPGENRSHLVCLVAQKLGVILGEHDIVFADRVGAPHRPVGEADVDRRLGEDNANAVGDVRPRPLVVRLARRAPREELLRAARVRRGADSTGFGLPGPTRRFYVNERLTRHNRRLFYLVRQECSRLNWRSPWTHSGRVFVRCSKESPPKRVRSEADFQLVFGSPVVC